MLFSNVVRRILKLQNCERARRVVHDCKKMQLPKIFEDLNLNTANALSVAKILRTGSKPIYRPWHRRRAIVVIK